MDTRKISVPSTENKNKDISNILMLLAIFLIHPSLIYLGIVDYEYRFLLLGIMSFTVILFSVYRGFTWYELGFRKDNLKLSSIYNFIIAMIAVLLSFLLIKLGLIRELKMTSTMPFFLFYVFLSCPIQEFMYRSVIYAECKRNDQMHNNAFVFLSTISYAFVHIFYYDLITMLATATMGFVWSSIYRYYPNAIGPSLSHAIVGVISIALGLV